MWIDVEAARTAEPREAAALTEAGLLPQFDVPWLREPREALEELRVSALETARPRRRRDAPAARAVAAAPFRESARAALIEALIARGNVAEAMRAYDEHPRAAARGARHDARPGARRAARAAARARRRDAGPSRRPPRPGRSTSSSATPSWRRSTARSPGSRLGEGGVLAFEGPAGIGKTRLLGVLRERALDAGATVLDARAGVLEREFGFGVVRQLFEAVAAGEPPPAAARAVFGGDATAGDGLFAVLSALFQYTAGLATRGPLVLCDRRPAVERHVLAALRRLPRAADRRAAGARRDDGPHRRAGRRRAAARRDRAGPGHGLRAPAAAERRRHRRASSPTLLGDADDAFAAACLQVTAGNPLLLRQLLTALAGEQVVPDAAHAASVRAIGPRAVSKTVLLRLARLPAPAASVARAVAILGEGPGLPALAELAGTDEAVAAETIEALVRAEILRADEPLGFVHPLVRDAVYFELPAARRGLEHARAARLLADLGASPERIAAQLMLAPPRGDAWVVERLREAARISIERGAPDAALAHLQRAQAEPPAADAARRADARARRRGRVRARDVRRRGARARRTPRSPTRTRAA